MELQHVFLECGSDAEGLDAFVRVSRDLPAFNRPPPAFLEVLNCCIVPEREFSLEISTDNMMLHRDGVFVIYESKWTDETAHEYDTVSSSLTSTPQSSPPLSPSLLPIANAPVTSTPMVTHIVTFKCIGAVCDERQQRALQLAFKARKKGEVVGVKIEPEPRNPYDARAIALLCMVEGSWQRIGYIVRELLEEVHAAISAHDILWVKFAWVNYLLQWTRSGPGFYAGINIARHGEWSHTCTMSASTKVI